MLVGVFPLGCAEADETGQEGDEFALLNEVEKITPVVHTVCKGKGFISDEEIFRPVSSKKLE